MNLLDLAQQAGISTINLRPISGTAGGEYHIACPKCGGKDRFVMQPNKQAKNCTGVYWCRQCGKKGDAIQFAIDFLGMEFKEAADLMGAALPDRPRIRNKNSLPKPVDIKAPSAIWCEKAKAFVEYAHKKIHSLPGALEYLQSRGITQEAVKKYKLGWCDREVFRERDAWGLEPDGRKVWLPIGIVLPVISTSGHIIRLKIRRDDYRPEDKLPRYAAVTGSMKGLSIIGNKENRVMLVVESELDAFALETIVGDLAFTVATGGADKTPDYETDYYAKQKKYLFICHDNDQAGMNMLEKWKRLYAHALPLPVPEEYGKDIGDAVQKGFDIRSWLLSVLPEGALSLCKEEVQTDATVSSESHQVLIVQDTLLKRSWRGGGDRG